MSDRRRFLEGNFTHTTSENYNKIEDNLLSMSINIAGNIVIGSIAILIGVCIIVSNI